MTDRELVIFASGIVVGSSARRAGHDDELIYSAAQAIRSRAEISSEDADAIVAELTSLVDVAWNETRRSGHDG